MQTNMEGVTYRLWFVDHPHWLIGSTVDSLKHRKGIYFRNATKEFRQTPVYNLIREVGYDGFILTEIDYHYFDDIQQLRQKEQALIHEHRDDMQTPYCLNIRGAVKDSENNKMKNRERCQKYAAEHKEEQKARARKHYDENTEKCKARAKAFYREHREEILARQRAQKLERHPPAVV